MRLKRCKKCGKDFETDSKYKFICSDCALLSKQNSTIRERICKECSILFNGGPRALYCPDCRIKRKIAYDATYNKNKVTRHLGSTDKCTICGTEYIVTSGLQRYCKECAPEAIRKNVNEHKKEYAQKNHDKYQLYKSEMKFKSKVCVICNNTFDTNSATVTCSAECAKERKSQNQATGDIKRGKRKTPYKIKTVE